MHLQNSVALMPDPDSHSHIRSHVRADVDPCSFSAFEAVGEDSVVALRSSREVGRIAYRKDRQCL